MKKYKIFTIVSSILLIIFMCIPIFSANTPLSTYYTTVPADLGSSYPNGGYPSINLNILTKFYLVIEPNSLTQGINIRNRYNDNGGDDYGNGLSIFINNGRLTTSVYRYSNDYFVLMFPILDIEYDSNKTYYIPYFCYNCALYNTTYDSIKVYSSTTTDNNELMRQYYELGYQTGYNNGYSQGLTDYPGAHDDWNLVQHIQLAIGFFIGDEYAQYVTPFAIAFTILMAYFIFIRWIFLFGKSQKSLRVADIVVIVACICVMAVMYINMITINIQNTNITDSVESSSEVIRTLVPDNVYKYIDDTKIESVYKIVDDVRIGG